MRLSVAVMAHHKRADMVDDLLTRLGEAVVVWDQINDRHDTGIRALQAFDPDATHHLVIQDDALPCRDLVEGIERALGYVPDGRPVSFYVGSVRPFRQRIDAAIRAAAGASWLRMPGPYWGPAIVVPTGDIPALSEWWTGPGARFENYDRRIARFYKARNIECWYSWPSLVDHRGDDSLSGHGNGSERRARRFLGADVSALTVDWSGPVVDLPGAEQLDARRQRDARRALSRR